MSHYASYIKEREDIDTMEHEHGFAMFKITAGECYIIDIYVEKEHRQKKIASDLADAVALYAKGKGCTYLVGSVCPSAKNATASTKVLFAYGFSLHHIDSDKNLVMFVKEL